jgi:hypothetical protein
MLDVDNQNLRQLPKLDAKFNKKEEGLLYAKSLTRYHEDTWTEDFETYRG